MKMLNRIRVIVIAATLTAGITQNAIASSTIVTDAVGAQQLWSFDKILGANKLTSKINQVDGKGINQTWDATGNKLSRTDSEGRVTTYTYNATNQRLSMTEASGTAQARLTAYEYVSADIDLVTKASSPSIYSGFSKDLVTAYDTNQNVTAVSVNGSNALGVSVSRTTSFSHDAYGNVTEIDGPRTDVNDITLLEYYDCNTGSKCGQLKKVTNAAGHVTSYDYYDNSARLTQSTDANGVVTTHVYHPRGWLLSRTQTPSAGDVRVTTYEYDNVGQVIKSTLPDGLIINSIYDAAHTLTEVSDNVGNKISYTYDAKGNRTHNLINDPDGTLIRSTITAYDTRNFISSINAGGSVTQLVNDAVGNLNSQTDPNANPSDTNTFDGLDRLTSTIDALSNSSDYTYDVADQLIQATAPNGTVTQYEYDDLGNQSKQVSADRGTRFYSHDAAGNVVDMTDARGIVTSYQYDALNRLTSVSYPDTSENVTYSYDSVSTACANSVGRLCKQLDESGSKVFSYDAFGNLLSINHLLQGQAFSTQYQYDSVNRLIAITYPSGRLISYTRDILGRVTDVTSLMNGVSKNLLSARTYRADGLTTGHALGNTEVETKSYDLQGRLTQHTLPGSVIRDYSYDQNGNITLIDDASQRIFEYDVLDRLDHADYNTFLRTYNYDKNSNRTESSLNGTAASYDYTPLSNQLESINTDTVVLDLAGNTLSDQNGARSFEYNQAGRLKRLLLNNVEVAQYIYNDNGLRVLKSLNGIDTSYHYSLEGQLISESQIGSDVSRDYVYVDSQLVAILDSQPLPGPSISSPAANSVLSSTSQTFTWQVNDGEGITEWWLWVGTAFGSKNKHDSRSLGTSLNTTVSGLPDDGSPIYARLFFKVGGEWLFEDTVYSSVTTAPQPPAPAAGDANILAPLDQSLLTSSSQTFSWSGTFNVTEWWFYLGTAVGANDLHDSGSLGLATSTVVSGLLENGNDIHARIFYKVGGVWLSKDYSYSTNLVTPGSLVSPQNGDTLSSISQNFSWQGVPEITEWWLYLGSHTGGKNLHSSGSLGTATSTTVNGLPDNGAPIYAQLYYKIAGTWSSRSYSFVAEGIFTEASITSPRKESRLNGRNQTFSWQGSTNVTQWSLRIRDGLGNNYFQSGELDPSTTSLNVTGLAVDSSALIAELGYKANSDWSYVSTSYTAAQHWALSEQVYYVHTDHLGTPDMITDASQRLVWQAGKGPFGGDAPLVETVVNNVRFPGQYYDVESGLHYNWNRYYDPEIGRYVTSDPIGLDGGLNTYGYVGGNPLMYVDSLGLARFGFRPLGGDEAYYDSNNTPDGSSNHHRAHEQLWFDDNPNENAGFFAGDGDGNGPAICGEDGDVRSDGGFNRNDYDFFGPVYDDDIMRQALDNTRNDWNNTTYCVAGRNCQHFSDTLRQEYDRLKNPLTCRMTRRGRRCN
jgi:RHS repeat-associated protein